LITPVLGSNVQAWIPYQFLTLSGAWADVPQVQVSACPAAIPTPGAAPAVAQPARPPVGTLVFQLSSGGDIMLIHADGSGLRRLTYGIDPVLSPDGQAVAFTRWGSGDISALWTINVDGSHERALVGEMHQAKGPDWSPDGSRIVLNFQRGGFLTPQKHCFDLSELQEKSEHPKAPNPPLNAYDIHTEIRDNKPFLCWKVPADAHWSLRVVSVADGSFQDLYGGTYAFRPAWDPIQAWRVVADSGYGLLQTDVTDATQTHSKGITDQMADGSPVFSPDGRYIAVVENASNIFDIHRLNADGSGRLRLTQTPLWVTVQPGQPMWNNVAPAWSPDSSQIAFLTDRTGRWEIWLMKADGSNPHAMFPEAINNQLPFKYDFNDERVLSWR
jgi:Tol biopolymer transport system component